jgi:hypothetical protein
MSSNDSIPLPEDSNMESEDTVMMEYGESELQSVVPAPEAPAPVPTARLGLLEVLDRNGATANWVSVTQWPVTVGRGLSAQVVIDDVHIAPEHLRISALDDGFVVVQVLDTINGVRRGNGALMRKGMRFDWSGTDDLGLGRWRLRLRLAGAPLEPEQALPTFPWKTVMLTVALVLGLLAQTLLELWLDNTGAEKFAQTALPAVAMLMGGVALWAGVWALATKLFTGHQQFLRHVRIVCGVLLVDAAVLVLAYLLAFMFSWESLARLNDLLTPPILGVGIFLHLMVIAPQRRRGLMALVAGVVLVGTLAMVGSNWQKTKRLTNELYLSALFPPSWRLAPAVPVEQLMEESKSIESRLEQRLKDQPVDVVDADDEEPEQEK